MQLGTHLRGKKKREEMVDEIKKAEAEAKRKKVRARERGRFSGFGSARERARAPEEWFRPGGGGLSERVRERGAKCKEEARP